ncbi:TMV resistance protein N-like [Nymphaea colorata]|nr:TMV resistance protein N-like [Nymphaea colorata]
MRSFRYLPIAGCVAAILEWIKNAIEEALQSPWLFDPAIILPIPKPVEVVEQPSSPTVALSPSPNEQHDFDIFLSFREDDTRNGFTGHLYEALCGRGLKTCIDNEDLHRHCQDILLMATGMLVMSYSAPATLTAKAAHDHHCYGRSRKVGTNIIVSVPENGGVVLSGKYSETGQAAVEGLYPWSSGKRLTVAGPFQPAECSAGRLIIPIFFGVEPSHVRHQAGPFQPAFKSYHNDKKVDKAEVDKCRDAFKTVANISGYSLKDDATWHEAMLVEKVVHHLQRHLDSDHLFLADNPVGMDSRTKDMMKLLQIERNGVKIVGRQLMEEIMDDRVTQIHNLDAGQRLFRDRIPPKKVLIVLDDVDHLNQLVLIGVRQRFASGSRIITTTRDESVLSLCKVDRDGTYKPELLDRDQSLHLFRRYAFQSSHQQQDMYKPDMYEDIQWKVVAVTGGLPLALRVFGSYLSDKSDRDEWKVIWISCNRPQIKTSRNVCK